MNHPQPSLDAVLAALNECGPMHIRALAEHLEWPVEKAHRTVSNARRNKPGQRIRVVGYERVQEGKGKDLSIYAAQAGEDVPRTPGKAKRRRLQTQARYRDKHRAVINARHRVRRQEKGQPLVPNVWAQLAPKEIRHAMTVAANEQLSLTERGAAGFGSTGKT